MNNIFQILIYSLFCIILSSPNNYLYPQKNKIEFEHFSTEQGLSINSIWCITQDKQGFIWIGTLDGLNRYDGYKFTIFKHNPNDITSLSNNHIASICIDKSGVLWIGTYGGGLNKYDIQKEQFTRYMHNKNDSASLSNNFVMAICEDKSGVLWVGTRDGLNKFDREKGEFKSYKHNPNDSSSLSSSDVFNICEDNSEVLWIGTIGGGLNKFDKDKEQFINYNYNPNDPKSLSHTYVRTMYIDKSDVIWVGTPGGGLNKFDKEKEEFIKYKYDPNNPTSLSNNSIHAIYEDNSGEFWIGTRNGLNKFDQEKEKFTRYQHNPNDPKSLSDSPIYAIYEDNSGVIWLGGEGGDLNKFVKQKERFVKYQRNPDNPTSLSGNYVSAIYEDNSGTLWVGSEGLNKFDKEKEVFIKYQNNPKDPASLSSNYVAAISEDSTGILWIASYGGLTKFDKKKEHFFKYPTDYDNPTSLKGYFVSTLYEDRAGTLWVGTDAGLNKFDKKKGQFVTYQPIPNDTTSLSDLNVHEIFEDNTGALWIGTFVGLNKFDKEKEQFTRYLHNLNNPTSLSDNTVNAIYEDKSGTLWIGTLGGGLNKFDREKEEFIHYGEAEGLPNDVINGILEDDHGNLWLSTTKGLSKYNPKNGSFRNYDTRDGLQDNEFVENACFKNKKGEMFFGGIKGLNVFHPDSIKDNSYISPVVITDFLLFNKSVHIGIDTSNNRSILKKSIILTKEIELTYIDYILSFEFAALDFHSPQKNKYAYMMEGFENKWVYTGPDRRFAVYTNLEPGEYIFRVKGSNNDGIWNEEGTAIKIIITPPWWSTWWAYTFYGLFTLSLLYSFRRYELNRTGYKHNLELKKVEADKLLETDKMKSRFFANISHEFRTPLTLILGPIEKIMSKHSDEDTLKQASIVKKNATQLLRLINQLLDLSKLEAGKLKLQATKGNIVSFAKRITMSFESFSERKKINLKFISTKDDIDLYFDKDKMAKILTNLLSNAFKFTSEEGEISVVLSETVNSSVEIKVRDTGIGIPEDELPKLFDRFYQVDASQTREYEGTGIGLALTRELVDLHNGIIKAYSKLGEGSEFTIELPLGRKHLSDAEILEMQDDEVILIPPWQEKNLKEEAFIKAYDKDSSSQILLNDNEISDDKSIVLIVEDNADVRGFIKDSLGNDFQIKEAINGEQGVKKAKQIIPDLIISDIMMPKMDGNELTRILKNDEKTSHIPIILLTAKSEQENKLESLKTGADDYLTKPFDTKELLIRIKNLINIRKKLFEKFSKGDFVNKGDKKKLSSLDEQFMTKVINVIENHISEEEFTIESFDKEIGMGRVQIYRKLKALTGKSPLQYIRTKRLLLARKMIIEKKGSISEIAYSVGFGSPTYFTRCFKEEFGYLPSNIIK